MISKKIFVYNCYNLYGNNTTLNAIRGVWTERDVFLCAAEMVLGHPIPKAVTSPLHPPLPKKLLTANQGLWKSHWREEQQKSQEAPAPCETAHPMPNAT